MTPLLSRPILWFPDKLCMDSKTVFLYEYLTDRDLVEFAYVLNLFLELSGEKECWCIQKTSHSALINFTASHRTQPQFKGRDARMLTLSIINQFQTDEKPVIVRRRECTSKYCINPLHYFYGTRSDVQLVRYNRTANSDLDHETIKSIRLKRQSNPRIWTYRKLSWEFKLSERTIAGICRRESYDF